MKKLMLVLLVLLSVWTAQAQKWTPTPTPVPVNATPTSDPKEDVPNTLIDLLDNVPYSRLDDGGFIIGDPDAPITIIQFSDWACSHCEEFWETIQPLLLEYLPSGQVKYEFRIFPTTGGVFTIFAGKAAECADMLREGGFWESYVLLYDLAIAGDYDQDTIVRRLSDALDLDEADLLECTEDVEQVEIDTDLGIALNIPGTPTVMVSYGDSDPEYIEFDGIVYEGGAVPEEALRAVIEAAQDASPTPTGSK
jgi:protein-disulfide isomerase